MGIQATVDEKSLKRTIKTLRKLRTSAVPLTVRNTLKSLAFKTQDQAIKNIKEKFTLRTKFTAHKKQVWVNMPTQRRLQDMRAEVGHTQDYMRIQEEGGTIKANKTYKPIPTKAARIGKSIGKRVRDKFQMRNIDLGSGYFFGNPQGKRGIFQKLKTKIVMLYDMQFTQVNIKKRTWLESARNTTATPQAVARIFLSQARKTIAKLKS